MRIEFRNFRSELQRLEIEALVEKNKQMIAPWVQTLFVCNWDVKNEDESALASMESVPRYLQANLNIYNMFFSNSEEVKLRTIIHEFLHTHVGGLRNLVNGDMIDYIKE